MPDIMRCLLLREIVLHVINHLNASNIINSIGLILDIIGALVLWKFALPSTLEKRSSGIIPARKKDSAAGAPC